MAAEGGYAASQQFQAIADSAASAAINVSKLAQDFAQISAAAYGLSSAAQAFASLQQTLALTNSTAQGTVEQVKQMSNAVRDLALGFKFTASEGASALYFLASAGYSVNQSLQALTGVMLLSQATLSDLAQTAETMATTMSSFGLEAKDSTHVANLFAASIAVTQSTIDKLSYSMRYVGPVAASMGASIDQTVVALSALYNAGNRGQQGGTLLREMLVKLVDPSAEAAQILTKLGVSIVDTEGKTKNFVDILSQMAKLNLGPSTLAQLFGMRGVAGAETLLSTLDPKKFSARMVNDKDFADQVKNIAEKANKPLNEIKTTWDYLATAMTNTNFATKLALEQQATLATSFGRAKNAVTELGISLGEQLAPGLASIANGLTNAVIWFRGLDDNTKKLIIDVPVLVVGILAATKAIEGMIAMSARAATGAGDFMGLRAAATNLANFRTALATTRTEMVAFDAAGNLLTQRTPGGLWTQAGRGARNPVGGQANIDFRTVPTPEAMAARRTLANTLPGGVAGAAGGAMLAEGAGMMGMIAGIASGVLTVATIGLILYQTWPLIKGMFESQKPGKSVVDRTDFEAQNVQQIVGVMSTPATELEKFEQFNEMLKQAGERELSFSQIIMGQEKVLASAKAQLKDYVAAKLEAVNRPGLAARVRSMDDFSMDSLADGSKFTGKERAFLSGTFSSTSVQKDMGAIQQKINNASKSIDDAQYGYTTVLKGMDRATEAQRNLDQEVVKQQRTAQETAKKIDEHGNLTIILDAYSRALDKDLRAAQLAVDKARVALGANPVEQFVLAQKENMQATAGRIQTFQEKMSSDLVKPLGAHLAEMPGYGPGAYKDVLSGGRVMMRDMEGNISTEALRSASELFSDGNNAEQVANIINARIEMFIAAYYAEAARTGKQVDPAVIKAMGDAQRQAVANVKLNGEHSQIDTLEAIKKELERQSTNRDFRTSLADAFIKNQNAILADVFSGSGGNAQAPKYIMDISSARKMFQDQMKQLNEEEKKFLDAEGFQSKNANGQAEIKARWAAYANAQKELINTGYVMAVKSIGDTAILAQSRVLGQLKSTNAQLLTGKSQVDSEIMSMLSLLNLNVPDDIRKSAYQLSNNQGQASLIAAIENDLDKARVLATQIDAIKSGKAISTPQQFRSPLSNAATGGVQEPALPTVNSPSLVPGGAANSILTQGFIDAIKKFEGFRATPYWDVDHNSIGYGTQAGNRTSITESEATAEMIDRLKKAAAIVEKINTDLPVGVKQAFTSLIFNAKTPEGGWANSGIGRAAAAGDVDEFGRRLQMYGNSGGQPNSGLQWRRQQEAGWFSGQNGLGGAINKGDTANLQEMERQLKLTQEIIAANKTLYELSKTGSIEKLRYDRQVFDQETQDLALIQKLKSVNGNVVEGLQYGMRKAAHDVQSDFTIAADAYSTFLNSASTGLTQLVTGQQKDWRKALANIAQDIANVILKALFMRALTGLTGGFKFGEGSWFGGGGGQNEGAGMSASLENPSQFAKGDVFTNMIVTAPTMFKFAKGGAPALGMMGEAGPEAIVPLKRGPDGKLGVAMVPQGSGVAMPINRGPVSDGFGNVIHAPTYNFGGMDSGGGAASPQDTAQHRNRMMALQKELHRETEQTVMRVVRKHQRPGGQLNLDTQRIGLR